MFSGEEGRSVVKASLLLYMQRQDHWHSSTAEAITGKENRECSMKLSEKSDRKSITYGIHIQFLSWVSTATAIL